MGKTLKLSVIILFDSNSDKKLLEQSIKSVDFADEILKIETSKMIGGFSEWRNEGLKKAKSEWVLYVDSDEEILPVLRNEILLTINHLQLTISAFAIPRRNFIFGKEFKYSGQYPDYQKRLFRHSAIKKWVGDVHEEPIFDSEAGYFGKIGHLKNPIIHHKNMTLSQMIDKTNEWSEIEGRLMFEVNHPPMNVLRFTSVLLREFYIKFIKEKAFLDGKEGIIYGIYQIYSKLISYSKLWEKQQSITRI